MSRRVYGKRKLSESVPATDRQVTLKLIRCTDSGKGVLCMEHWTRDCTCVAHLNRRSKDISPSRPKLTETSNAAEKEIILKTNGIENTEEEVISETKTTEKTDKEIISKTKTSEKSAETVRSSPRGEKAVAKASDTNVVHDKPVTSKEASPVDAAQVPEKVTDIEALLQNTGLLQRLIKEEESRSLDKSVDLSIAHTEARQLMIEWKRFHRAFQEGSMHVRIRYCQPAVGNNNYFIYAHGSVKDFDPVVRKDTFDIRELKEGQFRPDVVNELINPLLPHRLQNLCYAVLTCDEGAAQWNLISCLQIMKPMSPVRLQSLRPQLDQPLRPQQRLLGQPVTPKSKSTPKTVLPAPLKQSNSLNEVSPQTSSLPTSTACTKPAEIVGLRQRQDSVSPSLPGLNEPPSAIAVFPIIESVQFVKGRMPGDTEQQQGCWKIKFRELSGVHNSLCTEKVVVNLPIHDLTSLSTDQWWMVSLRAVPPSGLLIPSLMRNRGSKKQTLSVNIPCSVLVLTACEAVKRKARTFLPLNTMVSAELQKDLEQTACYLYGWPQLPGHVILGPLPARCCLPSNYSWVIRVPVVDDSAGAAVPDSSSSLLSELLKTTPKPVQKPSLIGSNRNTITDKTSAQVAEQAPDVISNRNDSMASKDTPVNSAPRIVAREVLRVHHPYFLPRNRARIFDSLDDAQDWLQSVSKLLNRQNGFECRLHPQSEPSSMDQFVDNEEEETTEKVYVGHIRWVTEDVIIPVYGWKLICVQYPDGSARLFRSAADVYSWFQSRFDASSPNSDIQDHHPVDLLYPASDGPDLVETHEELVVAEAPSTSNVK